VCSSLCVLSGCADRASNGLSFFLSLINDLGALFHIYLGSSMFACWIFDEFLFRSVVRRCSLIEVLVKLRHGELICVL